MPTLSELFGAPIDDLPESADTEGLEMEIVDYAKQFLGTRYRSGAKGPKAFDCSGFTSYVFKNFSLSLGSS
ncbi:MAG: C40 family peptidase, partial [Paramuribaculum sp.]|nr:C40 family peptidase [Paramuribaculum sp.]